MSSWPDVEVVRWPVTGDRRAELRQGRQLCLYVVDEQDLPPDDLGPSEEWVRAGADPIEVHWRTRRLQRSLLDSTRAPFVSGCTLVHAGRRVPITGADERLLDLLCQRFGRVVPRDDLRKATDPPLSDSTLATRLHRLRRSLAPAGLSIATVRGQGCVLRTES